MASAAIKPGELIAEKYRVERLIGEGGMSVVVAARHCALDQLVAVKLMRREAKNVDEAQMRFMLEGRALARLRSEHIARVVDEGTTHDGRPYIAMEYLQGIDLARLLAEHGPLPVEDAVDYVIQACVGLHEAHSLGIIHRDLKPGNLFLTQKPGGGPLIKIIDFGISKIALGADDFSVTRTLDNTVGSPGYMSPEQARSLKDVDARTDIWSLGVILYELLSGRLPFTARQSPEIFAKILTEPPDPLHESAPWVPPPLEANLLVTLDKDLKRRYDSVVSVAVALAPFASAAGHAMAAALHLGVTGTPMPEFDLSDLIEPSVIVPGPERNYVLPNPQRPSPIRIAGLESFEAGDAGRSRRRFLRAAALAIPVAAGALLGWSWFWPDDRAQPTPGSSEDPEAPGGPESSGHSASPVAAEPDALEPESADDDPPEAAGNASDEDEPGDDDSAAQRRRRRERRRRAKRSLGDDDTFDTMD